MFSSIFSVVDSVLSLDDGCIRTDILSGQQVTIQNNMSNQISARIVGTASLVSTFNVISKIKKFYIIVGKHKLEILSCMDLHPKPLALARGQTTLRLTNNESRYLEIKFIESTDFDKWLRVLGDLIAELLCTETLLSNSDCNTTAVVLLQNCILNCSMLTSPSKHFVSKVKGVFTVRNKLSDVMTTLRLNPCDVNVKDLKFLKESYKRFPELQSDTEWKYLIEKLPNEKYIEEDLKIILKDILAADANDSEGLVCAVAHAQSSSNYTEMVSAVVVNSEEVTSESHALPHIISSLTPARSSLSSSARRPRSVTKASQAVPQRSKMRITLNNTEMTYSPSSDSNKAVRTVKLRNKFTTPSGPRREHKPKSRTPPPNRSILAGIKYIRPDSSKQEIAAEHCVSHNHTETASQSSSESTKSSELDHKTQTLVSSEASALKDKENTANNGSKVINRTIDHCALSIPRRALTPIGKATPRKSSVLSSSVQSCSSLVRHLSIPGQEVLQNLQFKTTQQLHSTQKEVFTLLPSQRGCITREQESNIPACENPAASSIAGHGDVQSQPALSATTTTNYIAECVQPAPALSVGMKSSVRVVGNTRNAAISVEAHQLQNPEKSQSIEEEMCISFRLPVPPRRVLPWGVALVVVLLAIWSSRQLASPSVPMTPSDLQAGSRATSTLLPVDTRYGQLKMHVQFQSESEYETRSFSPAEAASRTKTSEVVDFIPTASSQSGQVLRSSMTRLRTLLLVPLRIAQALCGRLMRQLQHYRRLFD